MWLNMPQLIAAHQQLERTHLPTSFPPPTHSSRGRERGARCVWRVSTVHPHTHRQARERGSRERRAGTRLYVNHGIYATVSTCAATFDPLSTLRSGFWWCVASHNPRSGVWLFSHTPKNIAPRQRAPVEQLRPARLPRGYSTEMRHLLLLLLLAERTGAHAPGLYTL